MDLLQRNAQVAIACIRRALTCTSAPLVVGGFSMGGLVTRYALAWMEANRERHNTRVFVTIDTPHRAAYTNIADQWFAHVFKSVSSAIEVFALLLDSPANQQFVMLWVSGNVCEVSPLRRRFIEELDALGGYPKQPYKLAVACGRGDGRRSLPPHQRMLTWSESDFASATLWTLGAGESTPVTIGEAACFPATDGPQVIQLASDVSWEAAPGGQNVYGSLAAEAAANLGCGHVESLLGPLCAVPTISALDLDQSPWLPVPPPNDRRSPFDDYTFSEANQPHTVLTATVSDWLLDRVGLPAARGKMTPMTRWDPATFDRVHSADESAELPEAVSARAPCTDAILPCARQSSPRSLLNGSAAARHPAWHRPAYFRQGCRRRRRRCGNPGNAAD
jgi:hypothetical protein